MPFNKNSSPTAHLFPELRDLLLSCKLISAKTYRDCEQQAAQHGQSIEDYLYKSGLISHQMLQQAIAISQDLALEFVDGSTGNHSYYVKQKLCEDNGYNLIEGYKSLNRVYLSDAATVPEKFVTARDFRDLFIRQNQIELSHQAAHLLADTTPKLAAKFGMHFGQKTIVTLAILAIVIAAFISPRLSYYYISIGLSCIFLFASSIKIYSLFLPRFKGAGHRSEAKDRKRKGKNGFGDRAQINVTIHGDNAQLNVMLHSDKTDLNVTVHGENARLNIVAGGELAQPTSIGPHNMSLLNDMPHLSDKLHLTQKSHLNEDVDKLPIYSILVPLFREENLIKQLTKNLLNLDYPHSKLDIKLLFEQEDKATITAAKQLNLPECFEFIYVTPDDLQTKPRAMNFALPFVRGKYVTIYDAEDKPEADQLLKAVKRFEAADESLACLQASLEIENWNENWMARHFFIEYATLFNRYLPALEKLRIPLPLGGTSNHFKTEILRKVGGWDAHNVTEDADLGIRLALCGYRSSVLDSTTLEEANHRLIPWFKQRTRWLKGWLQTIIVHSRHPINLYRAIGPMRFAGFLALMCGMLFSSLLHPLIFAMPFIVYYTFDLATIMNSPLHMSIFLLSFMTLIIGYGAVLCSNFQAIKEFGRWRLLFTLITAPIYWLFISIAAWLAIREYLKNPFYWAKTEHGVSQYLNNQAAE